MQKNKQDDSMEFEDAETYSGDANLTRKGIIMKALQKAVEEGSKEMDSGGLQKRIVEGRVVEIVVPNQREIFINCVESLAVLVKPLFDKHPEVSSQHLKDFDKDMQKLEKEYDNRLNRANMEYRTRRANSGALDNKDLKKLNSDQQFWRDWFDGKKVQLYQKKLTAISYLLDKMNYFDEDSFTGEASNESSQS